MTNTAVQPDWNAKRTDETKLVEETLRDAGFAQVDAYRYNSASIRVRVIDPRFENKPIEKRDRLVDRPIKKLPPDTQRDIITLFTFAPSEIEPDSQAFRQKMLNMEFEHPSPSLL